MNPTLALPLLAALIAVACAAVIGALNPRDRANQVGALTMASVAWWAGCEVLWRQAADASAALAWHRIAAPGFIFLGAHVAWFLAELQRGGLPRIARCVPFLYALNAVFLGLAWSGDLVLASLQHTRWGYCLVPGRLLPLWFAQTALTVAVSLGEWVRVTRRSHEPRDGVHATRVGVGAALATVVAGLSDVLLASLGVELPRVGSLAAATAGVVLVVSLDHLGLSQLNAAGIAHRILQILPDGVALVRPSGRIRLSNPTMRAMICSDEPLAGRPLADHLSLAVLDPGIAYRAAECELVQATGLRLPVSVSTTPVHAAADSTDVLVIVRDVSEIAALRKRLATSERLAIVGRLAGGIAHEINNPLAFVRANLHHLRREYLAAVAKPPAGGSGGTDTGVIADFDELIDEALEGIDRAMLIVRDVNTFSHAGGDEQRRVALADVIDEALGMAVLGLPPAVRVRHVPAPEGGLEVSGSPQRLKQLFLNLLVNAVQAVGSSGVVAVEVRRVADRVYVGISDDGCGIAPEHRPLIFDPFFTTRPPGHGTGLGLAVCHEIVRSHGGTIRVADRPGGGTLVEVALPVLPLDA